MGLRESDVGIKKVRDIEAVTAQYKVSVMVSNGNLTCIILGHCDAGHVRIQSMQRPKQHALYLTLK